MHAKCRMMTGGLASPAANDGTGEAARCRICDMILSKNAGYWLLQHGRQLHTITIVSIVIEHMMTILWDLMGRPFSHKRINISKYTKISGQHKPLTPR